MDFLNRKSFGLVYTSHCQEPPISGAVNLSEKHKIKIRKVDSILEIHVKDSKDNTNIFKVISLVKCEGNFMASGKNMVMS